MSSPERLEGFPTLPGRRWIQSKAMAGGHGLCYSVGATPLKHRTDMEDFPGLILQSHGCEDSEVQAQVAVESRSGLRQAPSGSDKGLKATQWRGGHPCPFHNW